MVIFIFSAVFSTSPTESAGPLGDGGVVGEVRAPRFDGSAVGFEDLPIMEGLGRLRAPQPLARDGARDGPAFAALQRVGHGGGGDGAVEQLKGGDGAGDAVRADEGPRRVVDQHGIGRIRRQRLKPRRHRKLARGAAGHGPQQLGRGKAGQGFLVERFVAYAQGHDHIIDSRMLKKCARSPAQNSFSADAAILLRAALGQPGAHAAAARHDQGGIGAAILVLFLHRVLQCRCKGPGRRWAETL